MIFVECRWSGIRSRGREPATGCSRSFVLIRIVVLIVIVIVIRIVITIFIIIIIPKIVIMLLITRILQLPSRMRELVSKALQFLACPSREIQQVTLAIPAGLHDGQMYLNLPSTSC